MKLTRTISTVGVHCAGEVGDAIVGGVLNPPRCKTMYEKPLYFQNEANDIRKLPMNEPRGRPAMRMNLILPRAIFVQIQDSSSWKVMNIHPFPGKQYFHSDDVA